MVPLKSKRLYYKSDRAACYTTIPRLFHRSKLLLELQICLPIPYYSQPIPIPSQNQSQPPSTVLIPSLSQAQTRCNFLLKQLRKEVKNFDTMKTPRVAVIVMRKMIHHLLFLTNFMKLVVHLRTSLCATLMQLSLAASRLHLLI